MIMFAYILIAVVMILVTLDMARAAGFAAVSQEDLILQKIYRKHPDTRPLMTTPLLIATGLSLGICGGAAYMWVLGINRIVILAMAALGIGLIPAMVSLRKRSLYLLLTRHKLPKILEG